MASITAVPHSSSAAPSVECKERLSIADTKVKTQFDDCGSYGTVVDSTSQMTRYHVHIVRRLPKAGLRGGDVIECNIVGVYANPHYDAKTHSNLSWSK